jgi:hypothetical protein
MRSLVRSLLSKNCWGEMGYVGWYTIHGRKVIGRPSYLCIGGVSCKQASKPQQTNIRVIRSEDHCLQGNEERKGSS